MAPRKWTTFRNNDPSRKYFPVMSISLPSSSDPCWRSCCTLSDGKRNNDNNNRSSAHVLYILSGSYGRGVMYYTKCVRAFLTPSKPPSTRRHPAQPTCVSVQISLKNPRETQVLWSQIHEQTNRHSSSISDQLPRPAAVSSTLLLLYGSTSHTIVSTRRVLVLQLL